MNKVKSNVTNAPVNEHRGHGGHGQGKKIFLLRHDQVVFPAQHGSAGQPIGGVILGQLDYPITAARNHERYAMVARAIINATAQQLDNICDDIYFAGSDLLRVRQTFDHLLADLRRQNPAFAATPQLNTDKGFREQHFGAWHGMTYAEVEARDKVAYDIFWQDFINRAPPANKSPDKYPNKCPDKYPDKSPDNENTSESFIMLYQRATTTLEKLLATCREKNIVIVAHDGVLRAIMAFFYHTAENQLLTDALNKAMARKIPYLSLLRLDYEIGAKPVIEFL
ncbi:MAG: histidine phosphatase family protein [Hydrotalea sp.]|nr:histidine phosphatase family protein [Hydrotalea sp.]